MVEDYSIEVTDMDFARHEYKVEVSVIPKEYTDNTTMSIYFGTTECPLKADGYMFKGNITLPLNKTFNGNVTFLLANGKRRQRKWWKTLMVSAENLIRFYREL